MTEVPEHLLRRAQARRAGHGHNTPEEEELYQLLQRKGELPGPLRGLLEQAFEDAAKKRNSAGYSGEMGDGGARHIEDCIRFFLLGWFKLTPQDWEKFSKFLDPEYEKYLELKAKFGD